MEPAPGNADGNEWVERGHCLLDGAATTFDNLLLRSLLLRLQDRYDEEAALLDAASALGLHHPYLDQRRAWHALPLFERLVARAPFVPGSATASGPAPDIAAQLCIVTALGSDQPYFNLGIELIESIRATRHYRQTPICILDTGLSAADAAWLHSRFEGLQIRDPGFDLDMAIPATDFLGSRRSVDGMKGCVARPYIPKHFPGYRYYLWFDTDVWVQDERSVHRFVAGAVAQGVCSVVTPNVATDFRFEGSWWHRMCMEHGLVTEGQLAVLRSSPSISAGTFCIDAQSGFFERWAQEMKLAVERCGHVWGPDELTYMFVRQRDFADSPVLGFRHNFTPVAGSHGMPLAGSLGLLMPDTAKPVGIFHFCGMPKDQWFAPLIESETPVDLPLNRAGAGVRQMHSIHYRVWPWQDKPGIAAQARQRLQALAAG